jgi:hypothetical protein
MPLTTRKGVPTYTFIAKFRQTMIEYASIEIVISLIKIWNGSMFGLMHIMGSIGMVRVYPQKFSKVYLFPRIMFTHLLYNAQ